MPGSDSRARVSLYRCKPCHSTQDIDDLPARLPAALSKYVLLVHSFGRKCPPSSIAAEHVVTSPRKVFRGKFLTLVYGSPFARVTEWSSLQIYTASTKNKVVGSNPAEPIFFGKKNVREKHFLRQGKEKKSGAKKSLSGPDGKRS